jgi:uncharacterized protein (TIGR02145 family)
MGLALILIDSCRRKDDQPIIADVDGNVYTSVTIGTQVWMVENLKTTKYSDGTNIPIVIVTDSSQASPAFCWYNDDATTYKITYGALYNWYVVNTGKLCPIGWHVPTSSEWTTLVNSMIANGYNYDDATTGNKIAKAMAETTLWTSSIVEGSVGKTDYAWKRNATGFTAVPGGIRINGTFYGGNFYDIGYWGYWWSATEYRVEEAFYQEISHDDIGIWENWCDRIRCLSVRCLKNQ